MFLVLALPATTARALDKQGAAHRGGAGAAASAALVGMSGQVFGGLMPYNPTYAATPDNRGHALVRAGGHVDVDLPHLHVFVPLDLNVFTDRDRGGARRLAPSEVDLIGGVATMTALPGGSGELGARVEWDRAADGGSAAQHYADLRARYMLATPGGLLSGWAALGWFFWNPSLLRAPGQHRDARSCATSCTQPCRTCRVDCPSSSTARRSPTARPPGPGLQRST